MKGKTYGIIYYIIFYTLLLAFSAYVLLDTFVIPHTISRVQTETDNYIADNDKIDDIGSSDDSFSTDNDNISNIDNTDNAGSWEHMTEEAVYTDSSYRDENISINITTEVIDDTTVYIADVVLADAQFLKTAFAKDTFGTNVTETTSAQADAKGAILAVNGDFYGANKKGYVIKNGIVYRESVREDSQYDDLVIYEDGSFGIINEKDVTAEELSEDGVVQLFAFGPVLVENGEIVVDENAEVGKAMASNPRTAIGIVDGLHYILVVADGRSSESEGLSLYELAEVMQGLGCETAYNLDGGGSSTMYFNRQVINKPTTSGHSFKEREVSDIVYIGY